MFIGLIPAQGPPIGQIRMKMQQMELMVNRTISGLSWGLLNLLPLLPSPSPSSQWILPPPISPERKKKNLSSLLEIFEVPISSFLFYVHRSSSIFVMIRSKFVLIDVMIALKLGFEVKKTSHSCFCHEWMNVYKNIFGIAITSLRVLSLIPTFQRFRILYPSSLSHLRAWFRVAKTNTKIKTHSYRVQAWIAYSCTSLFTASLILRDPCPRTNPNILECNLHYSLPILVLPTHLKNHFIYSTVPYSIWSNNWWSKVKLSIHRSSTSF